MATSTTAEQTIDVVTPAAGESVTEGTILEWHAKVGDPIKVDDTIVEISTDKVDVELPSPATGTVSEILAQEGDTVTVGQVIARIVVGEPAQNGAPTGNGAPGSTTSDGASSDGALGDGATGDGASSDGAQGGDAGGVPDGVRATPVAARAAAVEGVDLANVSGSGPGGQIRKADVLSAGAANGAGQATARHRQRQACSSELRALEGRRGGARALHGAVAGDPHRDELPHAAVTVLDARRRELKAGTRKVSFTHLIAYAIARAGTDDMPVMANHFDRDRGQAAPRR